MYVFVLVMLLPGQATTTVPDHQVMIEEMLAHIYVTKGPEAMRQSQQQFESQSPSQVRIIHRVFLDAKEKEKQYRSAMVKAQQQSVLNQAKLNLVKAQAYRDHLKREFNMTVHIKKQELEVLKSANAYTRRAFSGYYQYRNINRNPYRRYRYR